MQILCSSIDHLLLTGSRQNWLVAKHPAVSHSRSRSFFRARKRVLFLSVQLSSRYYMQVMQLRIVYKRVERNLFAKVQRGSQRTKDNSTIRFRLYVGTVQSEKNSLSLKNCMYIGLRCFIFCQCCFFIILLIPKHSQNRSVKSR